MKVPRLLTPSERKARALRVKKAITLVNQPHKVKQPFPSTIEIEFYVRGASLAVIGPEDFVVIWSESSEYYQIEIEPYTHHLITSIQGVRCSENGQVQPIPIALPTGDTKCELIETWDKHHEQISYTGAVIDTRLSPPWREANELVFAKIIALPDHSWVATFDIKYVNNATIRKDLVCQYSGWNKSMVCQSVMNDVEIYFLPTATKLANNDIALATRSYQPDSTCITTHIINSSHASVKYRFDEMSKSFQNAKLSGIGQGCMLIINENQTLRTKIYASDHILPILEISKHAVVHDELVGYPINENYTLIGWAEALDDQLPLPKNMIAAVLLVDANNQMVGSPSFFPGQSGLFDISLLGEGNAMLTFISTSFPDYALYILDFSMLPGMKMTAKPLPTLNNVSTLYGGQRAERDNTLTEEDFVMVDGNPSSDDEAKAKPKSGFCRQM